VRALLQVSMLTSHDSDCKSCGLDAWLGENGYNPINITFFRDSLKELAIKYKDCLSSIKETRDDPSSDLWKLTREEYIAFEIILSIPNEEHERDKAISNIKHYIHFSDRKQGQGIDGIICTKGDLLWIRWRHKSSHNLERAMEDFVENINKSIAKNIMFKPFDADCIIQVRETSSLSDSYTGRIKLGNKEIIDKARKDKKVEFWASRVALFLTFAFVAASYCLDVMLTKGITSCTDASFLKWIGTPPSCIFIPAEHGDFYKWLGGIFDRLGTVSLSTSVLSYANYYYYLTDLRRKPNIDWK
jgi:hypothetical protein